MEIRVERYGIGHGDAWAGVLRSAKNGIFQFERAYMEYHADRFSDISLLAFADDQPVAILPAAIDADGVVTSHPGLTFGGVVLDARIRSGVAFDVFDAMFRFLRECGGRRCVVKLLPAAFSSYPAGELEYALWRRGFTLQRRDLSSLLPLDDALPFNSSKQQGAKKASKAGIEVGPDDVVAFHALLQSVLSAKHGVAPVHSSEELALLQGRFPDRIFCRMARLSGTAVAGAVVFDYGHVWHTQYLACSDEGRDAGALDLVVQVLIREARERGAASLSFGTSTVDAGRVVNEGLLWQKESYGARAIVHDFYEGEL